MMFEMRNITQTWSLFSETTLGLVCFIWLCILVALSKYVYGLMIG